MESDTLDRELIAALKRDGVESRAPAAARRRVAGRLASAGALGLGASVAETARALATTSTGATVSGHATGGVASLTLGGLVKTLVIGMGLGASAGVGLHAAFAQAPHAVIDVPRPHAAPVLPRRDTTATARHESTSVGVALGTNGASAPHAVLGASTPSTTKRTASVPVPARSAARSEDSMNPGPELPAAKPSVNAAGSLAEQQRLLDSARAALRQGDARRALAFVSAQREAFPQTAFAEERELLTIQSLLALGRVNDARTRAGAFRARFPQSLLTPSLRSALAAAGVAFDSETEATTTTQSNGVETP